jgi:hypothetical protein
MKSNPSFHQEAGILLTTWRKVFPAMMLCLLASLAVHQPAAAQNSYVLSNTWSSVTSSTANRQIGYSAQSNEVFVASTGGAIAVYDGTSGASVGSVSFSGVTTSGTQPLNQIGVADDGVIYGANLTTAISGSSVYRIYRWSAWDAAGAVAYAGDPTASGSPVADGQRIGDSFAIAGAGTGTRILTGIAGQKAFILFSTTDGANFTPTVLTVPTLPNTVSGEFGLAFYTNNTFIVKPNSAGSIYLVQYPADFAANSSATGAVLTSVSFPAPANSSSSALLAYNPDASLLGVAFLGSSGSSQSVFARLYTLDFDSGTANLLTSTNFTAASNGNLTGGVAFGGAGKTNNLYVLNSANNLQAYQIYVFPPQPPGITTQPVGGTVYPPYTLTATASGATPLSYQWQVTNNTSAGAFTNIPDATNLSYTINDVSTNYYRLFVSNYLGSVTSSVVFVQTLQAVTNSAVSTLWTVTAGQAGYSYLPASGNNTRGIAYDANSHNVVISATSGLYIMNGDTGATNGALSLTGVTFGGLLGGADQVGIADDGAVYAGNLVSGGANFELWRWPAPTNGATATLAYSGDPGAGSGDRWGDNLAVRGAGTGTQILLASKGTNVALLTTTDGSSFSSALIHVTGVPSGFAGNGIAFGAGNTFWAKVYGGDLWEIAYDTNTLAGSVVFDYQHGSQIGNAVVGVGIDSTNGIFAGVNLSDTPNDLQLFQLTGTSDAPVLFNQTFFGSANANGNANAAIAVKYPRIYALDVNNGVVALTYGVPASTKPVVSSPPASVTAYTNIPTLILSAGASGSLPLYYQWQFSPTGDNDSFTNLPNATSSAYTLTNPPLSAAGYYQVIVHNIAGYATSTPPALLTLLIPTNSPVATNLWTVAPGSISAIPTFDSSSYAVRGLAYDTNTDTVLLADHNNIYLLNASDGSYEGQLNMAGVPTSGLNGWLVDQIGVADDGVLYSCNLSLNGPGFAIIGWNTIADGAAGTSYAYGGATGADPGNGSGDRWGDTMSVRGSGTGTEILISSYSGTNVVLFTTTDGSTFTANLISVTNVPAGFSGLGIAFGAGDTFWTKSAGYLLRQVAFDRATWTAGAVQVYSNLPSAFAGVGVDATNGILGGVSFADTPNDLQLYLLSGNESSPALFDQGFFGANNANSQENAVTVLKGGKAFALDVNNGLVALNYGVPGAPAVTLVSVSYKPGTGVTITWDNTFSNHRYQVEYKNSLSDATWTPIGSPVVATGATASYTDTTANGNARFYRVITE